MARNKAVMRCRIEGNLERAAKIPGWLEQGQRVQLERAGSLIRDDLALAAPGGPTRSIGRSIRTVTLTPTRLLIESRHPGAKPLDTGAFIRSKRGKGHAIAFRGRGGRMVFVRYPRGVKIKATGWAKKGLRSRRKRIQQSFDEVFENLERSVGS